MRLPLIAVLALLIAACVPSQGQPSGQSQSAAAPPPPAGPPSATEIPIGASGGMCGGIAGFQCRTEGDYCSMVAKVCAEMSDAAGICAPKPIVCTMDYRPVCGCDGVTYANECGAASAGVSVAADGECPPLE